MTASYNGFDGAFRDAVQAAELEPRWKSGEWARPTECDVCGQTEGTIHGHLEDYSRPETYIPLCVTCHLTLHYRFRMEPAHWEAYKALVSNGGRMPAKTQRSAWGALQFTTFVGNLASAERDNLHAPARTFLDTLGTGRGSGIPTRLWIPRLPTTPWAEAQRASAA